jgi:hypothetical protein
VISPLQKLYHIFGQAVFLPIPKGSKNPGTQEWQLTTFADTQAPAYQQDLEELKLAEIRVQEQSPRTLRAVNGESL